MSMAARRSSRSRRRCSRSACATRSASESTSMAMMRRAIAGEPVAETDPAFESAILVLRVASGLLGAEVACNKLLLLPLPTVKRALEPALLDAAESGWGAGTADAVALVVDVLRDSGDGLSCGPCCGDGCGVPCEARKT